MKKTIFKSKRIKDTKRLADIISKKTDNYRVICLYGDLGSGKTTFVKSLAKSLGISERIISPTFVLVRKHSLKNGTFYHVDAYRINDDSDNEAIQEILEEENSIVAIEWAEKIEEILPERRIDIKFLYKEDEKIREIKIIERK